MSARLLRALAFAVLWLPALAGAWLMAQHAVEVPVWDDLERATLLDAWQHGTLDWSYLYSLHAEHRRVVPRLITLASASLGSGSLVVEQGVTFALVLAAAVIVHLLVRRTFPESRRAVWGATLLANLALLSTMHWETFLWAAQLGFVVPPLAAVFAVWVMGGRAGLVVKGALCALACLLATWSHVHGVLLWGVVFGLALLQPRFAPPRGRAIFLGVWVLVGAAVLVPHFTVDGFPAGSDHGGLVAGEPASGPQLATLGKRLPRAALFAGAILGSPLARLPGVVTENVAPEIGGVLGWTFGLCALWAVAHFREEELWARWLPWLAVGGFALVACLVEASGRSVLHKWQFGLTPRYLGISTYLLVATAVLLALWVEDGVRRHPHASRVLAPLPGFGLGILVAVQAYQWGIGLDGMHEWRLARLHARTSILFLDHFEPESWRRIDEDPEAGRRLLKRLDATGYLDPPLLREPTLAGFARADVLPARAARVTVARRRDEDVRVSGYAWLPDAERRADGVLFVADGRVLGIARVHGFPRVWIDEADHIFNEVRLPGVEDSAVWRGKLPVADLPDVSELRLDLYAVESDRMRVHPLGERIVLRRAPGEPPEVFVEDASADVGG